MQSRLLSAGCSGRWYFDWIEQCYGRVSQHIGIEFYSPKPESLPDNVTWIVNSVSNMSDVADASIDLVFSGQNLEHLWPDEVAGFMAEAARVTREGGSLVVDSPNRSLTAPMIWSHGEHTVELTVPEMEQLMCLAGFAVTKTVGIWLCRDPRSGRLLDFDITSEDSNWSAIERLLAAGTAPRDSFIWWMEGRRTSQRADRDGVAAHMTHIFARAWPERVQRLVVGVGCQIERRGRDSWVHSPDSGNGVVLFGPYMPLRAGRYRVDFDVDISQSATPAIMCDVVCEDGSVVLARATVVTESKLIQLSFELERLYFNVQFRCFATGGSSFAVRRGVTLIEQVL